MTYMHSLPHYWDRVSVHGGIPVFGGIWDSIITQNATYWASFSWNDVNGNSQNTVHFGPPYDPSMIYTVPGCSPADFYNGGSGALWMLDTSFYLPSIWSFTMGSPSIEWVTMRKSHNIYGITVDEALYGVGMPGVHPYGPSVSGSGMGNIDPFTAITSANTLYPQYASLNPHIVRDWSYNMWRQYNKLPFQQISNGNPPEQCLFWIQTWAYYLGRLYDHTHGNTPGSYSNIQYNLQGNIANVWIYKYNMFLSKAHWAQTGSEGCGCGGFQHGTYANVIISSAGFIPAWAGGGW